MRPFHAIPAGTRLERGWLGEAACYQGKRSSDSIAMRILYPVLLSFFALPFVAHVAPAQLAPSGRIDVEQPGGVHYLFGSGGTHTGGGFFYLNYLTGEFDVVGPVSVSSNGAFLAYRR